jgi:hypothetical protein
MEEREPYKLPRKKGKSERDKLIKQAAEKCVVATKKFVIETLQGRKPDMENLLRSELGDLYDKGYNNGLKDMDQMHAKAENVKDK